MRRKPPQGLDFPQAVDLLHRVKVVLHALDSNLKAKKKHGNGVQPSVVKKNKQLAYAFAILGALRLQHLTKGAFTLLND